MSSRPGRLFTTHRTMFGLDVPGSASLPDDVKPRMRTELHRIVREAAEDSGLTWDDCHHEDRGDGLFAVLPPDVGVETVLGPFLLWLQAGLREHAGDPASGGPLRLRMAVDAGFVTFDAHGVSGADLDRMFRLLDAPVLKELMRARPAPLGLITSDPLYQRTIRTQPRTPIAAEAFARVPVAVKELDSCGWVWMPVDGLGWLGGEELTVLLRTGRRAGRSAED